MRGGIIASFMMFVLVGGATPACADSSFFGGVVGASIGGLLGSQFGKGDGRLAATGLGVAVGAVTGSAVGASLSRQPPPVSGYSYPAPVYYQHAPYEPTYVAPPDPPTRVVYVNQPVYVTGGYVGGYDAPPCREYTQTTHIGNQWQKTRGLACLQPDGTWRLQ